MIPETIAVEAPFVFTLPISSGFIWIVFVIVLVIFAVYTAILLFHWFEYAIKDPITWPSTLVYLAGSSLLIIILFFAAIAIA